MNNLYCTNCHPQVAQTQQNNANAKIAVQLLELTVPRLCPVCGPVYNVAKIVSNNPNVSEGWKNIAAAACGVFLVFAGIKFLDDLAS